MCIRKMVNILVGTFRNIFKVKTKYEDERREICKDCQFKETFAGIEYCGKCGCVIESKIKVKQEKCVIGKW